MVFTEGKTEFKDMGYEEYLLEEKERVEETPIKEVSERPKKKTFTTPAKEKAKKEKALKKAEERVAALEQQIEELKSEIEREENLSDYLKLSELGKEIETLETELLEALEEWEKLAE